MPDTIDAAECAALLRCSPDQVEEMARGGDLPGLKIELIQTKSKA